MRILQDECVPRKLRHSLIGHHVQTPAELGWTGKKNGELLRLMENAGFELFLTVDQNVQFQQNLSGSRISIIILVALSNRLSDLLPLVPALRMAIDTIQPGECVEVSTPST